MLAFAIGKGDVLLIVAFAAIPLAAFAFARAGGIYDEIGKGVFALDRDSDDGGESAELGDRAAQVERELEIRQMLEAKAFRQAERGEPVLDVEAEMDKLLRPQVSVAADPELVEEVRQLVVARNERRLRQGKDPLDVEAEIERQLAELEGLGG